MSTETTVVVTNDVLRQAAERRQHEHAILDEAHAAVEERFLAVVRAQIEADVTVAEAARAIGVSRGHLHAMLKRGGS